MNAMYMKQISARRYASNRKAVTTWTSGAAPSASICPARLVDTMSLVHAMRRALLRRRGEHDPFNRVGQSNRLVHDRNTGSTPTTIGPLAALWNWFDNGSGSGCGATNVA